MLSQKKKPRRGILLLVVLSLLVLFVLIGLTFMVSARHFRDAALSAARIDRSGDAPKQMSDMAIMQILRGTTDVSSAVYGHSLLNDIYGQDGFVGEIPPPSGGPVASFVAGGEFIQIEVANDVSVISPNPVYQGQVDNHASLVASRRHLETEGYYNGGLITFTSGHYVGQSARIVQYDPSPYNGSNFDGAVITLEGLGETILPGSGDRFVVNGPAFNGVGAGYDIATASMNMTARILGEPSPGDQSDYPIAFLPNFSAYPSSVTGLGALGALPARPSIAWSGGLDESYDIADYQNMFLAWQPARRNNRPNLLIPSYHRPSIALYWLSRLLDEQSANGPIDLTDPSWKTNRFGDILQLFGDVGSRLGDLTTQQRENRSLLRAAIMRPLRFDHASPNLSASNLVQLLGFDPVDGPWDVDNDGDGIKDSIWLDLGSPVQRDANGQLFKNLYAIQILDLDGRLNLNAHGSIDQANPSENYGLGQDAFPFPQMSNRLAGWEGSELHSVAAVHRGEGFGPADIYLNRALFRSNSAMQRFFEGRYGADNGPGISGQPEFLSIAFREPADEFVRPTDFHAVGGIALNPSGQPVYVSYPTSAPQSVTDTPYELNLVSVNGQDAPYSIDDLEPLLRFYDSDVNDLPDRIMDTPIAENEVRRSIVTTHSFDVPVSGTPLDPLFFLYESNSTFANTVPENDTSRTDVVPPAMRWRQKLDLNRQFENDSTLPAYLTDRQDYAKHLYCMMMALTEGFAANLDLDTDGTADNAQVRAKEIAQWAINAADFRDSDSKMTPFIYDITPLDGWDVDSNLATTTNPVVWGVEKPDLLISETLALHDRRTEELDPTNTGLEQRLSPMGSLFIELYNPWTATGDPEQPANEIYGGFSGVQLQARTPGDFPVWRTLIVSGTSKYANPDDSFRYAADNEEPVQSGGNVFNPADVDRVIYFVDNSTLPTINDGYTPNLVFAPSTPLAGRIAPIEPGRYAVIGPSTGRRLTFDSPFDIGTNGNDKSFITQFGRAIEDLATMTPYDDGDAAGINASARIILNPNAVATSPNQVVATGVSFAQDPTAIVIDQARKSGSTTFEPRRLSVSEPVDDYRDVIPGFRITLAGNEGEAPMPGPAIDVGVIGSTTGIVPAHRTVFLQRLADPTRDFDAATNPYLTIDKSHIDVNAFNGVETTVQPASTRFKSLERGWKDTKATGVTLSRRHLWRQELQRDPAIIDPAAMPTNAHVYNFILEHTLGKLNRSYGDEVGAGTNVGQPDTTDATIDPTTMLPVDPTAPHAFPWLTFNNRPFANAMELLLVPRSSSARLLHDFNVIAETNQQDLYTPVPGINSTATAPETGPLYRHLMNFFSSNAGNISMLFDFVEVNSPYVGTRRYFTSGGSLSRFRDPGKVNLNTINDHSTWNAVYGSDIVDAGAADNHWSELERSKRVNGYNPTIPLTRFNVSLPTQFPRPFRSASSASFAPNPTGGPNLQMLPVDAGLLRRKPAGVAGAAGELPLLDGQQRRITTAGGNLSILNDFTTAPTFKSYSDESRNPFFRYQQLGRLSATTTSRSNVFAVRITVGRFAVQAISDDLQPDDSAIDTDSDSVVDISRHILNPDGYRIDLEQELGIDTGEIQRSRSFYVIDRSVPVGFEVGRNHNTENAIILRRQVN